ncbi:Hypothetical Protein FCC1311_068952 [Hondaea fermentalgiana]|uniref:DUF4954 domain-containing protein n=1 Tax=Hondaea fermentalgiana TaxID=2315210 RepID=A0A2R5GJ84_9STRA|nr:Hypothetical Protein FCC1311_068952 [Hondaea fermentalgiana]|eukprot:GBG30675.1 Hypothetical Protein FCC1311_068952 [Hondaea fermentalgiana]
MDSKSELARHTARVRELVARGGTRKLRPEEKLALESQGNSCGPEGWDRCLEVQEDFSPRNVRGCVFLGRNVVGKFDESAMVGAHALPAGLYHSTLRDCYVADNARISHCELVQETFVGKSAMIAHCGVVTRERRAAASTKEGLGSTFGNGVVLPVVIGTGGRDVAIYAEMDIEEACAVACKREDATLQTQHAQIVSQYVDAIRLAWNVVDDNASVDSCAYIADVFVGAFAQVSGSHVVNATILSSEEEPTSVRAGADVRDSILQWSVSVDSQSVVHKAFMCVHSHAERHGKLLESILGPFSGVAEGEISESLVGPFVGFHHQALLIASYWPSGKGNVGYGANVGSNHTGKAPDQELWHGEGVFYGLGCCIKFPSDFSHAPYTLVATGVTTLPQRLTMPFSLISSPQGAGHGLSPAINQVFPGWALSQNMYAIMRNEFKYEDRAKRAKRVRIRYRVLRPQIIAMMRAARDELRAAGGKDIYTDRDIAGLGKNYMTESARREAIEAYTHFMCFFAAREVFERACQSGVSLDDIEASLTQSAEGSYAEVEPTMDYVDTGTRLEALSDPSRAQEVWKLAATVLQLEGSDVGLDADKIQSVLGWYREALCELSEKVATSKQKDEQRGKRIIPGYMAAHGSVDVDDKVVRRLREMVARDCRLIDDLVAALPKL